jgi:hypothetical protein
MLPVSGSGEANRVGRPNIKLMRSFIFAGVITVGSSFGSAAAPAQAQSDVVESARSLCAQAVGIWETHDQWALRNLSTIYNDASSQMSGAEFEEMVNTIYGSWAAALGIEQPCHPEVLTFAANPSITRNAWETFNRCLQTNIDARKNAVETFVREHQSLSLEVLAGPVNVLTVDTSRDYLVALARGAGLRNCRP